MPEISISALYRYPVKGLSADPLDRVEIETGETLPGDRIYAVENGTRDFDPINPAYFTKAKFLQLMSNERLAALQSEFDQGTQTLTIHRNGKQVAAGNLSLPIGRQLIEQFLSAYLADSARGAPRIVSADRHHFCDVPDRFVSLINLATIRDLERITGRPVDPRRFRANVYVDGLEPWGERQLVGKSLAISGMPLFAVEEPIGRCAAINVDPETGARDMHLPRTLQDVFEHDQCGVYMSAIGGGSIALGDTVEVATVSSAGNGLGI